MTDGPGPKLPEALRKQGLTGAEDNVGEDQTVAVPGSLIHQFFGAELLARLQTNRDEKGEAADG